MPNRIRGGTYTVYKLSKNEKYYLRQIVINTRNEYLRNNKYIFIESEMNDVDEKLLISIENVEINFEIKIKSERDICAPEIEKVFKDKNMFNIVKALTLREKLVFFSYYFEKKTDAATGKALNINGDTARKIRVRALDKIKKNYKKMKGNDKNV